MIETTQVVMLLVILSMVAGFGAGALWMDATRTVQAKDRRVARRMRRRIGLDVND